jgi:hypothetical protein
LKVERSNVDNRVLPPEVVQLVATEERTDKVATKPIVPSRASPLGWLAAAVWIGGPTLVILAAFLLHTGQAREVLLPWSDIALPETCNFHSTFGLDCPGCGLTRSFIHLAHGRPAHALKLNPLSIPLFIYVLSQIPLATLHLYRVQHIWLATWTRLNERMLIALIIGLALQWVLRVGLRAL